VIPAHSKNRRELEKRWQPKQPAEPVGSASVNKIQEKSPISRQGETLFVVLFAAATAVIGRPSP